MKHRITIVTIFMATLMGCDVKNGKTEEEKLMQVSRDWSRSVSPDSVDRVMSYWADDAVYMPPGQSALVGKEAILKMVAGSLKNPGFKISWEPQSAVISKSGDMGYLIEKSQITVTDSLGNSKTEYYKGLTVWRKVNGAWKNIVEMVNTDPHQ